MRKQYQFRVSPVAEHIDALANISRELKKLGYVKLSARPRHHAQDQASLEAFKKGVLQPSWQRSARGLRADTLGKN